jgi:hypothetical protein
VKDAGGGQTKGIRPAKEGLILDQNTDSKQSKGK